MAIISLWTTCLPTSGQAAVLTLQQAVALVQQNNPALHAQQQAAQAWARRPAQAVSLPDPVFSLSTINIPVDTWSTSQENMSQVQLGISQALPFPGKLALLEDAAIHVAQAASANVDELKFSLISQVSHSWWNLLYLQHAMTTVQRNQDLLRQLIRIAHTKYKVGKGLQQDVLLAQLELSKLLDVEIQLQASEKQNQAQLQQLLQLPMTQPIVLPEVVDESLPMLADAQTLTQQALVQRPRLKQQYQHQQAARSRVMLADKADFPDFTLTAKYGWRKNSDTGVERADLASLNLSMTMPFFTGDKQDALQEQRRAELLQQDFLYQDLQSQVVRQVQVALAAYEQAKAQSLLFKTAIIPQAKQTVTSMLAAYQVNKVDFLNLIGAQITLYNYETQYWKVLAQAKQSLAILYATMGQTEEFSHE
ncbi:MAG: TolC family protein [Mariprofundaceae bacterium]|nr:TolC family protein [Mariprofundaceae bacterium]